MSKKKTLELILFLLLVLAAYDESEARTFGCFLGVIGMDIERKVEVDYNHYQLYARQSSSNKLLPFIGCGISFDF